MPTITVSNTAQQIN